MLKPEGHCAASSLPRATLLVVLACLTAGCGLGLDSEQRLARAQQALADGDVRTAVIDSKNVLLDEPDNAEARLVLGLASLAEGNAATAEKELRRAAELGVPISRVAAEIAQAVLLQGRFQSVVDEFSDFEYPDGEERKEMRLVLGQAFLGLQQQPAAREQFRAALAIDPDLAPAQLGIAESYMAEGNLVQARSTLTQVLDLSDDYAPAWLNSGRLYARIGNTEAAYRDFDRARELAAQSGNLPVQTQAIFGMAEARLADDDIAEARRLSGRLEELAPGSIATLQTAARIAIADEEWVLAQEKLSEILRRAPDYNGARAMLGALHLQSGNLGQAEMYLSAVVVNEPGNARARQLLAETRLRLNKADEATEALRPMLDDEDTDPQSLQMAARVSILSGDYDSAATYLERNVNAQTGDADAHLNLAVAYLLAGRTEDAQEQLRKASVEAGGDAEYRRDALGVVAAYRAGGAAPAQEASAALVEAWPQRPVAHILHGAMLLVADKRSEAREAFSAANTLDPENTSALRYLARIEVLDGNMPAAIRLYEQILAVDDADVPAMVSLGVIAAQSGDASEAVGWFEKARAADSSAISPRLLLGRMYLASQELDKARAVAAEAIASNPQAADAHNTLGLVNLIEKQPGKALESFEQAVDLAPEYPDYRLNLARAYSAGGDIDKAQALLSADEDRGLEHLPTGLMLAVIQAQSGNVPAALETARRLRSLHPDSSLPIALEAEMHGQAGNLQLAVSTYDEALAKEITKRIAARAFYFRTRAESPNAAEPLERFLEDRPLDSDIRLLLAEHYHRGDAVQEAMAEYLRVLDIVPDNFVATNNLAWLYMVNDDPRAEGMARRAYALAPNNASVVDTLGWILVQKNQLGEGIELLRKAVSLADRPEVRFHLAAALAESGEVDEARRHLQEILESDDDFQGREEARNLLATL